MPFRLSALLAALFCLSLNAPATAGDEIRRTIPLDRIELKEGRPIEGTVMLMDSEQVVMRVKGRDKRVLRNDISSLAAKVIDVPAAIRMHASLRAGDVDTRLQLAKDFRLMRLPLEARLLLWEVLLLDPENVEAHEGLNHRRSGKRWLTPVDSRWQPYDKALVMHTEFKDAWQLPTTHFNVRTDLPLAEALRFAWLLEGAYYGLYELFGAEMGLYHVIDPIDIWIYTALSDFPNQSRGPGFFAPAHRRAYTLYDPSLNTVQLHEMVHATLFFAKEVMGHKPVIPGWLDEGIAEYLPRAVDGNGLVLEGMGDRMGFAKHHFETHSQSKKSYGLKRCLTFAAGDFHADNLQAEKYAAAYSLTHYLMHGESSAMRDAFFEYMRSAVGGKATSKTFKKTLAVKNIRDFDKAWSKYSRDMAGI